MAGRRHPQEEQDGTAFSPDELRDSSRPLLDWLAATGCTRVAIHFDASAAADEVGFTIAEYFRGRSCTCSRSWPDFR